MADLLLCGPVDRPAAVRLTPVPAWVVALVLGVVVVVLPVPTDEPALPVPEVGCHDLLRQLTHGSAGGVRVADGRVCAGPRRR